MAEFSDSFDARRGDSSARNLRALDELLYDPQRLDRERRQYRQSPPPCTLGSATQPRSPAPLSDEQQRFKLEFERAASFPRAQFFQQKTKEEERLYEADLNRTHRLPVGASVDTIAYDNVRKRWTEQGIWNDKWGTIYDAGLWKHEEPLELESESEIDSEAESSPRPLYWGMFRNQPQPKQRRQKSDDEKQRIAERLVIRKGEREASRPYYQFFYQISKEREQIEDESGGVEGTNAADINTKAYENVKKSWMKQGIWNRKWGVLPGMSWKHREPLEQVSCSLPAPTRSTTLPQATRSVVQAPTHVDDRNSTTAQHRGLFGDIQSPMSEAHVSPIFGYLPLVEPENRQESSAIDLGNANTESSPLPPQSPHARILRPATRQALLPTNQNPSYRDPRTEGLAEASLRLIHSSKVSRASGKSMAKTQRRIRPSPNTATAEIPSTKVPLRRSKRIQAKEPPRIASAYQRVARSTPKRNVVGDLPSTNLANP